MDALDPKNPVELPEPNEKLLRQPTFLEKYGWLKTVLIIILLIICIDEVIYIFLHKTQPAANYVVHPTISPTRNWKTYTDTAGKFTIQYPANYVLTTENATSTATVQLQSGIIPSLHTPFALRIQYKPVSKQLELPALIQQNKTCPAIAASEGRPTMINNKQPALMYVDTTCGQNGLTTIVYTIHGTMFYTLTIAAPVHFVEVKPYLDTILATLRFN